MPEALVQEPKALSDRTFEKIRKLIYDKAGIDLRQGKQTLVSARLGKKLRESGLRDYDTYLDNVIADKTCESMIALIDALTTNSRRSCANRSISRSYATKF